MTAPTELDYIQAVGHWFDVATGALGFVSANVTISPRVPEGMVIYMPNLDPGSGSGVNAGLSLVPTPAVIKYGELRDVSGSVGVQLLGNSADVAIALAAQGITSLIYDVKFSEVTDAGPSPQYLQDFAFYAPASGTVDLTDPNLVRLAYGGTTPTFELPDNVTAFGASLVGATDLAAAQGLLGIDKDVLNFDNLAEFPTAGKAGVLYIANDTGFEYRWSVTTSAYVQIVRSPATTDALPEGNNNLYYTDARADGRVRAGIRDPNTIALVGDSISALGSEGWYQPWLGHTWINQLQVMSYQRIRYGAGNFSVAGTPISNQHSVQLPEVLAMNPLPGKCVLAVGTNDIQSTTYDFNTTVATLKDMIAQLEAVNVEPILWCVPPNNHVGSVSIAIIHARTYAWNTWIRRYAALNGYALVDAYTALAQADGTPMPGTIDSSLIHPTGYGARLIAEQFLADGGADRFPPNSLVHTARTTDDLSNMFNDGTINLGLFTTDTNSDGIANGLSGSGSGTHSFSLVSPSPADQLMGKWQRLSAGAGGVANMTAVFTTGWSLGDTIAFSHRIRASGVDASGGALNLAALKMDTPGGYETPDGTASLTYLWNGLYQWDGDVEDGEAYVEFVIPPEATDLQLWMTVNCASASGSVDMDIGELTVRNLSTGGLLV